MPHSASAKKRNTQNLRNRERNRAAKSALRGDVRKVLSDIEAGDLPQAREALRIASSAADKAAAGKKIRRNKAARIKSRLSKRLLAASKGIATGNPTAAAGKSAPKKAPAKKSTASKGSGSKGKKTTAKSKS